MEPLGMRRDPAQDFDHLPYRTIIHSEGVYFIGWIRIHTSPSADFRLWPTFADLRGAKSRLVSGVQRPWL
jgi:hypothetical protein